MVANALAQAQTLIEEELCYPLVPAGLPLRRIPIGRHQARWGHVIAGGVMRDTVIQAGAVVNYAADPATITLGGVTCAIGDIHVYHAGTSEEIAASAKTLSPARSRYHSLVPPRGAGLSDNPETGWDYASVATWGAATVDVHCITNDTTTQATLARRLAAAPRPAPRRRQRPASMCVCRNR